MKLISCQPSKVQFCSHLDLKWLNIYRNMGNLKKSVEKKSTDSYNKYILLQSVTIFLLNEIRLC
jgi:hypothetical protein